MAKCGIVGDCMFTPYSDSPIAYSQLVQKVQDLILNHPNSFLIDDNLHGRGWILYSTEGHFFKVSLTEFYTVSNSSLIDGATVFETHFIRDVLIATISENTGLDSDYVRYFVDEKYRPDTNFILKYKHLFNWIDCIFEVEKALAPSFIDRIAPDLINIKDGWKKMSRVMSDVFYESSIRKYKDLLDWAILTTHKGYSLDFIYEFKDKWNYHNILSNYRLSEEFLRENFLRFDIARLIHTQKLSEEFLWDFRMSFNWNDVVKYQTVSSELLDRLPKHLKLISGHNYN